MQSMRLLAAVAALDTKGMALRDLAELGAELYFINCGCSPCPRHLIFAGESDKEMLTLVWGFYALRLPERLILIDCGFADNASAAKFGVELVDPFPSMASLGLNPDKVHDILITHHHFDHVGNLPFFPNANIHIERRELAPYRKEMPLHPDFGARLQVFDNAFDLADLVRLRRIGGHTAGCCEAFFKYKGMMHVIPGDECYMRDNYLRRIPIGFAADSRLNRAYVEGLPDDICLFTFHDPGMMKDHASAAPEIVRVLPA